MVGGERELYRSPPPAKSLPLGWGWWWKGALSKFTACKISPSRLGLVAVSGSLHLLKLSSESCFLVLCFLPYWAHLVLIVIRRFKTSQIKRKGIEYYKLYFEIFFNSLSYWIKMIFWYSIRVLMIKQSRVQISLSLFI
jgi:hypothetical protein